MARIINLKGVVFFFIAIEEEEEKIVSVLFYNFVVINLRKSLIWKQCRSKNLIYHNLAFFSI
jgi:hypothetical protein